jgi:signal transduction histidine kinase
MLNQLSTPTRGLLLGLMVTLLAVIAYSGYLARQLSGLRRLQSEIIDRNRRDSLQLMRIQNNLNSLGLAMRDILDQVDPYPVAAWAPQFQRIRKDLDDALKLEESLTIAHRTSEQRGYLADSLKQFWDAVDRMFALAKSSREAEAREQVRISLQPRQASLGTTIARFLIQNNENEQRAVMQVAGIYEQVEQRALVFLAATLIAILLTGFYSIRSNRRIFARMAVLSEQRSELAQKLISMQESTLRYVSRELHDEFGQILTAIGLLLGRAGQKVDLEEIREIAQSALEKVRTLSQSLHPVILDEAGLENALDWYLPTLERQTGMTIRYEKTGEPVPIGGNTGIHVYRVVQEALNNVARHSGAKAASVRLQFLRETLQLEVEDHGTGLNAHLPRAGIGLVAMRERAELLGGRIEFLRPQQGGTLVRLTVPIEHPDSHESQNFGTSG